MYVESDSFVQLFFMLPRTDDVRLIYRIIVFCVYLFSVIITKGFYNIFSLLPSPPPLLLLPLYSRLCTYRCVRTHRMLFGNHFRFILFIYFLFVCVPVLVLLFAAFQTFGFGVFWKHSSARLPIHIVIAHLCVRKYLLSAHTPNVIAHTKQYG